MKHAVHRSALGLACLPAWCSQADRQREAAAEAERRAAEAAERARREAEERERCAGAGARGRGRGRGLWQQSRSRMEPLGGCLCGNVGRQLVWQR